MQRRGNSAAAVGCVAAVALAIVVHGPAGAEGDGTNPFAFVAPSVVVSAAEQQRLDRDEVVVRTLSAGDGQAAVFVATQLQAAPESLITWTRAISALKRNEHVLAIGRFSEPPALADLNDLVLDQRDVDDLRNCRPAACALKLTADEMAKLAVAAAAGDGHDTVQRAFRQVVLDRVRAYRSHGLAGLPALADSRRARHIAEGLIGLVDRSPYLSRVPAADSWLRGFPAGAAADDAFLYWSKEAYGSGKPVISVTHVGIFTPAPAPDRPAVIVASKQLLATHYASASLGLMMVLPGAGGRPSYFGYLNRTELDLLGGWFGSVARIAIERRMARQVPVLVRELRARLESGPPPVGVR